MRYTFFVSTVTGLLVAASAVPAAAYIDPGAGSLAIQAIVGILMAAGVAASVAWGRLKGFMLRLVGRSAQKPVDDAH